MDADEYTEPPADDAPAAPSPAEALGLDGARLAARTRQALYRVPPDELARLHERVREACIARHMDYFHEGRRETIRVFPCPITVLPEQLAYAHAVTRTLHAAMLRMPELYLAHPEVRRILRLTPAEDEWLRASWTPAHAATNPVFDRLDALVDFASPIWKETFRFIEPNLTGVGGLYLIPSVEEVVDEVAVPLIVAHDHGLRFARLADCRELLLERLRLHLGTLGRSGGRICLVEPKYELEGIDEQRRLVEYYAARHGISVLHADPSELVLRRGEVYCGDQRVDLVYRDYGVLDLVELEAEGADVSAMRALFRENRVVSSIGAELDHKSCWEILTDPALAERYFSEEERRCFGRHVLWTRVVGDRRTLLPNGESGELMEFARREQETLVLKPSRGYGGEGVLIGHTVSAGDWEHALNAALGSEELWVVQRMAQIPVLEVPALAPDGTLHPEAFYHVSGFASGPHGLAILARASQRQVVNVAQRGGMCAVLQVQEA